MHKSKTPGMILAGICAGAVAGIFGAGGGMVLVPLLVRFSGLTEEEIFPSSVTIILPICLVTLVVTALQGTFSLSPAFPYMLGSAIGGWIAGRWGKKVPVAWLHRGLGILILWGGIKYLC